MIDQPICYVAGKSGGHILPCLTLANIDQEKHETIKRILFFSANTPLDYHILAHNPRVTWHIPLPLDAARTHSFILLLQTLWHLISSFCVSFYYLWMHKPARIITTGGAVAVPVCYAGFLLRIPIILYCLDVIPGKATRAIAPIASSIITCFKKTQTFFKNAVLQPYPVRYTEQDRAISMQNALKKYTLDPTKKTIAILGGSQGSSFLNMFAEQLISNPLFNADTTQIIHQTGGDDSIDWNTLYTQKNVTAYVFAYQKDLSPIYAAADLIICRAGAGTLFEILFFNKKCIIIPLITETTYHQLTNAQTFAHEYPALCSWMDQALVEQHPQLLIEKIIDLLD